MKVSLMFSGGTIDSVGADRLDLAWYIDNNMRLESGELLARIPEARGIADLEEVAIERLPSHAITLPQWLDLARTIQSALETSDAVVLTHGTNTLEETAYFLHLVLKSDRPVVLTGSMRPASALSSDGELNLINAIRVAVDVNSRGKGVLVVLNDTIHGARDRRVVICQAGRVGSGRVARGPKLKERGFVTADNLTPWKARVLLALGLTQSDDPEVIQSLFDTH